MKGDSTSSQLAAKARLGLFLRLGRLEYLTVEMLVAVPAYLATGAFYWPAFLAVALSCPIRLLATSYVNYYTDQVEDRVNAPARVKHCETFGYDNVRRTAIIFWILAWLWGLLFVYLANLTVVLIYYLGLFFQFNYSLGLRFKRHALTMAIPYALCPLLVFAGPWTIHQPLRALPPVAFVLAYESAVLCCTIKNLPDALGDRRAGRWSFFTGSPGMAHIPSLVARTTPFFWQSTHLLVVLLVWLKVLAPKYLLTLVTLPMTLYGVRWMLRVGGVEDKEKLFRYAYLYSLISKSLFMFILSPTPPVLGAIVTLIVYSYVASYLMSKEQFSLLQFYTR